MTMIVLNLREQICVILIKPYRGRTEKVNKIKFQIKIEGNSNGKWRK
jgi:hypothetical protein